MKKRIFALLALPLTVGVYSAQIVLPQQLRRPIEQALIRNKEIANKQLDLEKARLERQSVINKHLPRVQALGGYAYLNSELTVDVPTKQLPISGNEIFADKTKVKTNGHLLHGSVMASSVLYSGGQINNGAKALEERAAGDELMIETDRDNVVVDVVTSFDKLKYIAASEDLLADSERRLQKEEERVNRAIQNGLAVPFDRDKIKLARLDLESKRTQLEENKSLLYQKITYLTGLDRGEIQTVSYDLQPIIIDENLNIENRQELDALKAYRRASEYNLKREKGTYLPQVLAVAGMSYTSLQNPSSDFDIPYLPSQVPTIHGKLNELTLAPSFLAGVVMKWDIFNGNERKHKVEQATLSLRQVENRLEDSRDKLNLLLTQKRASYNTQWKQMDLAEQQETVSRNTLTLAGKQYALGLISVSQRLEAENDFVKAAQNKTETLTNQRRAAMEMAQAAGRLTQQIQYQ